MVADLRRNRPRHAAHRLWPLGSGNLTASTGGGGPTAPACASRQRPLSVTPAAHACPTCVLGRSRHVHVCSLLSCGSQAAFVSRQEPGYRLREGSPATVRQGVPGPLRTQRALRSLAGIDPPREPLGAACPHHVGAARPHHVGAATAVRLAAGPVAPHAPCGLAQPTSLPRGMALGVQRVFQAEAKGKFCWPLDTEGRKAPVPSIMGSFPQALPPGSAGGTMV